MSLSARQSLLARFLDDEKVERAVRADPMLAAKEFGVDPAYAAWLAALEPRRVSSFRKSRVVKAKRRGR